MNHYYIGSDFFYIIPEVYLLYTVIVILVCGILLNRKILTAGERIVVLVIYLGVLSLLITVMLMNVRLCFSGFIFDNQLRFDLLFNIISSIVIITVILNFIFCIAYIKKDTIDTYEYIILIVLISLGLCIMLFSNHLLLLYLGLELHSLGLYILATYKQYTRYSTEAGLKYFILGAFSSGVLLFGLTFIYGSTGLLKLNTLSLLFFGNDGGLAISNITKVGVLFIIIGLLFKIGVVPFHAWVPDIYQGAPMIITAFFASIPKIVVITVLIKLYFFLGFFQNVGTVNSAVVCGLLTIFVGSVGALGQINLKRWLAYSAITHVGYIWLAIVLGSIAGFVAVYLYVLIYILMIIPLFAIIVSARKLSNYRITHFLTSLGELYYSNALIGFLLTLILFSLGGIPPLPGFFAKLYVFLGIINAMNVVEAIILVILSGIGTVYYLRQIKSIILAIKPSKGFYAPLAFSNSIITVYCIVSSIILGLNIDLLHSKLCLLIMFTEI